MPPIIMRGGMALLFVLASLVAGCTPQLKMPGPDSQAPALAEKFFVTADGVALPLYKWPADGKPKAIMLAVHGFNDYGAFIKEPARYFKARGIQIYSYDQRGFGAAPDRGHWPGKDAFVRDLSAAARLLKARHPDVPLYLIGVSMGGAVILAAMTSNNPPPAAGVILVAPAVWGRETQPFYQRWTLALAARLMPGMTLSGQGLNIKPSDNIPMLRALSQDPLVIKKTRVDTLWGLVNLMDAALAASKTFTSKTLILYGDKDEIIGQEATGLMLSQLPKEADQRRMIKRYPNGYHMLLRGINAGPIWQDILSWMVPAPAKTN